MNKEKVKMVLPKIKLFFRNIFSAKNRFFSIFLLACFTTVVVFVFVGGYVSFTAPVYRIENQEDFDLMRDHPDASFRLTKQNIEIKGKWTPIGTKEKPFTGELNGLVDGKRCSISFKLDTYDFVSDGEEQYFGLFGVNNGTIRNVQIYFSDQFNPVLTDNKPAHFGLFAGINNGSVSHCNVIFTKNVSFDLPSIVYAGCFAGSGKGNYVNLHAQNVNITNRSKLYACAGGICGLIDGNSYFDQCWVKGIIKDESNERGFAGGFAGRTAEGGSCRIVNGLSEIKISGDCLAGGFVGESKMSISLEKSYSKAMFVETIALPGGFLGNVCNAISFKDSLSNVACDKSNNANAFFIEMPSIIPELTNCYWIRNANISSSYGQSNSLSDLTLDLLKWDKTIWAKKTDFYLL